MHERNKNFKTIYPNKKNGYAGPAMVNAMMRTAKERISYKGEVVYDVDLSKWETWQTEAVYNKAGARDVERSIIKTINSWVGRGCLNSDQIPDTEKNFTAPTKENFKKCLEDIFSRLPHLKKARRDLSLNSRTQIVPVKEGTLPLFTEQTNKNNQQQMEKPKRFQDEEIILINFRTKDRINFTNRHDVLVFLYGESYDRKHDYYRLNSNLRINSNLKNVDGGCGVGLIPDANDENRYLCFSTKLKNELSEEFIQDKMATAEEHYSRRKFKRLKRHWNSNRSSNNNRVMPKKEPNIAVQLTQINKMIAKLDKRVIARFQKDVIPSLTTVANCQKCIKWLESRGITEE